MIRSPNSLFLSIGWGTLLILAASSRLDGQYQRPYGYRIQNRLPSVSQQNPPRLQHPQGSHTFGPGQPGYRYQQSFPQMNNNAGVLLPSKSPYSQTAPYPPTAPYAHNGSVRRSGRTSAGFTPVTNSTDSSYRRFPRMIAEFEPQRAIVLSVCDLQPHHRHVLKQIVERSAGHANILILYNTREQLKDTVELLSSGTVDHVSFYQLKLDTVWLRDFGPRIVEVEDGTRSLDFFYYGVRPYDDAFPERWSLETDSRLDKIPWTLQGGNLICNGTGLGIATSRIFDDNAVSIGSGSSSPSVNNAGKNFVLQELKRSINLKDLIILEPLQNESTKHVDMFAAFLAPDHVLVAELGPRSHPTNARILNNNARRLARIKINGKLLRVSRIRIPQPNGTSWSTYTNAIITDRLILLPTMKSDPPAIVRNAIATYKKHLPDHHIATVDITSMKNLQGSLHCLSINLPASAPLPQGVINFDRALQIARKIPGSGKSNMATKVGNKSGYTIDEQLRRIFKSSTQDYLVDAYCIEFRGDVVTLLRADNRKIIRVKKTGVCLTDQYWLNRNTNKIRKNGARVRQIVSSQATTRS